MGDILRGSTDWSPALFTDYISERKERLRRRRITARIATTLFARFEPEDIARRGRFFQRIAADPKLRLLLTTAFAGPERIPAKLFRDDTLAALLA